MNERFLNEGARNSPAAFLKQLFEPDSAPRLDQNNQASLSAQHNQATFSSAQHAAVSNSDSSYTGCRAPSARDPLLASISLGVGQAMLTGGSNKPLVCDKRQSAAGPNTRSRPRAMQPLPAHGDAQPPRPKRTKLRGSDPNMLPLQDMSAQQLSMPSDAAGDGLEFANGLNYLDLLEQEQPQHAMPLNLQHLPDSNMLDPYDLMVNHDLAPFDHDPIIESSKPVPCQDRQQQYCYHMRAALDLLTKDEHHRLVHLTGQHSAIASAEALLSLVDDGHQTPRYASAASNCGASMRMGLQPPHCGDGPGGFSCRSYRGGVHALTSVDGGHLSGQHLSAEASRTAFAMPGRGGSLPGMLPPSHHPGHLLPSQLSLAHPGGFGMPRHGSIGSMFVGSDPPMRLNDCDPFAMPLADPQFPTTRPYASVGGGVAPALQQLRDPYAPGFMDHAAQQQHQQQQRDSRRGSQSGWAALKEESSGVLHGVSKPAGGSRLVRKPGPPSSRDKVWDMLSDAEKGRILADQMSAAEGTKALLDRRAVVLGCQVAEMPDDDDWGVGFKLTECKATSAPLANPKTCSICLRKQMVFHRHSYYCRRCAQLYRAIHRKKTNIQSEQGMEPSSMTA